MKAYTKIIFQRTDPLTDNEITKALMVSEQTEWWRALTQLIEQYRTEYAGSAARCAMQNNPLAMASDNGAHEALTGLLIDLERRRSGD